MELNLSSLERKIEQVVALCEQLRSENHALRQRIAGLEQEREALVARMGTARERLETIMDRLPGE